MYLLSNGTITNVVHLELDLHFEDHKIRNANILKTGDD